MNTESYVEVGSKELDIHIVIWMILKISQSKKKKKLQEMKSKPCNSCLGKGKNDTHFQK